MWQLLRYIMLVGKGNIAWEDQEGDIRKMVRWRSLLVLAENLNRGWPKFWSTDGQL